MGAERTLANGPVSALVANSCTCNSPDPALCSGVAAVAAKSGMAETDRIRASVASPEEAYGTYIYL
jgi:hypothetical protein